MEAFPLTKGGRRQSLRGLSWTNLGEGRPDNLLAQERQRTSPDTIQDYRT